MLTGKFPEDEMASFISDKKKRKTAAERDAQMISADNSDNVDRIIECTKEMQGFPATHHKKTTAAKGAWLRTMVDVMLCRT